jgi:hypothetical protein
MSNLFWLGVGGAAIYLLTRKNQIAPAVMIPAPELPSVSVAPIVPAGTAPDLSALSWLGCPPGEVFYSRENRCVPAVSVAPAYLRGPV